MFPSTSVMDIISVQRSNRVIILQKPSDNKQENLRELRSYVIIIIYEGHFFPHRSGVRGSPKSGSMA